jgi:predicted Zn-dependent protease
MLDASGRARQRGWRETDDSAHISTSPMRRFFLPAVTGLLLLVVAADRVSRVLSTSLHANAPAAGVARASATAHRATPAPAPVLTVAPAGSATPTVDRLARLAVRRQLSREAGQTYLDSLLATSDSLIRRWPDRGDSPLRVALIEGGPAGYNPRLKELVRQALARWTDAGVGVRFMEVPDTAGSDIVVRWIDRFEFERAGQTDLTWDQLGRVRRATIALALHASTGATLGDQALLAVAVHEAGHAIGLPHSADSNDVMFPSTRTSTLSDRDVRTAQLLYQLPPGPVKDLPGP